MNFQRFVASVGQGEGSSPSALNNVQELHTTNSDQSDNARNNITKQCG